MKIQIFTAIALALVAVSTAKADYLCKARTVAELTMMVDEDRITRVSDTEVSVYRKNAQVAFLRGTLFEVNGGMLFEKKYIEDFYNKDHSVTVSSSPRVCSRTECESGFGSKISALLKQGEEETLFDCQEAVLEVLTN